jgi:hypothetical protein
MPDECLSCLTSVNARPQLCCGLALISAKARSGVKARLSHDAVRPETLGSGLSHSMTAVKALTASWLRSERTHNIQDIADEAQKAETGPVFNKIWFMMVGGLEYWS